MPGFGRSPGFIGLFGRPERQLGRQADFAEIAAILAAPEVQARNRVLSVEPVYEDDVTFTSFLSADSAKWKELLQSMPMPN